LKYVHLTDAQFYQLCINNSELKIKRAAREVLEFMPASLLPGEARHNVFAVFWIIHQLPAASQS
jgi:hypothetical protein